MKPVRLSDRALLDAVATRPCQACLAKPSDPAHIRSRGAGGGDYHWNVMPLCRIHHIEQHKIGWTAFAEKYSGVLSWLVNHRWYWDGTRLRRDEVC